MRSLELGTQAVVGRPWLALGHRAMRSCPGAWHPQQLGALLELLPLFSFLSGSFPAQWPGPGLLFPMVGSIPPAAPMRTKHA